MKKIILTLFLATAALILQAQPQIKIGYVDIEYLFSELPDGRQIETELKSVETQLTNQVNAKIKELQDAYAKYVANEKNMLDAIRANAQRELEMLQANLEKLKEDAQTTLQNKQTQLLQPVYKKISTAIEAVSKEHGYSLILNARASGQDLVIYGDEKVDISDLVLQKLGVTPKPTK